MTKLVNRAKMTTATTGTGTITLGSASSGYQSFADAGVVNGDVVRYVIEDGVNWEIGTGTYTASGTTLSRTVSESSNSDAAITLSGNAVVYITAIVADILQPDNNLSDLASASTARTNLGLGSIATQAANNVSISGGSITGITDLAVSDGGTGASSFTANNVLLGNGTSAFQVVAPGTSGNVLTSNGTTWTSATPAPSAGVLTATATGSLADGDTVIINSDGTVSAVGFSVGSPSLGSRVIFDSTNNYTTDSVAVAYDSTNDRFVVALHRSTANTAVAYVGTVSGTSISFGSPVTLPSPVTFRPKYAAFDTTNDKVVIFGVDGSAGKTVVGTVSGTSISFGTYDTWSSSTPSNIDAACYDPDDNQVLFTYSIGSLNKTYVRAAQVSGTNCSFGTEVEIFNASVRSGLAYDASATRTVVSYRGTSGYGTARTVQSSSGVLTLGTATVFQSSSCWEFSNAYDSTAQNVVIAFRDGGDNNYGKVVVGDASGSTISFGSVVTFSSLGSTIYLRASYDANADETILIYNPQDGNSYYSFASVSGTTVSVSNQTSIESFGIYGTGLVYDSTSLKTVMSYMDGTGPHDPSGRVLDAAPLVTNLTAENYVGISNGAYSNGATATVQIVGSVDDAQTGLTAGQAYYVQEDGSLSQTPDTPSVFAGTAVSSTKIIVKG